MLPAFLKFDAHITRWFILYLAKPPERLLSIYYTDLIACKGRQPKVAG